MGAWSNVVSNVELDLPAGLLRLQTHPTAFAVTAQHRTQAKDGGALREVAPLMRGGTRAPYTLASELM